MLLYGNKNNIQDQCVVFNFTSLIEGYNKLLLVPPNNLGANSEYEFDVRYMHYILDNDMIFISLMQIIYNLYINNNVYLIVSEDEWSEVLIESLLKLIQQRYGINATRIRSFDKQYQINAYGFFDETKMFDDLIYAKESTFDPNYGLTNLDIDMDRYEYLGAAIRLQQGGGV